MQAMQESNKAFYNKSPKTTKYPAKHTENP